MPRLTRKLPSYRLHKPSGKAVVTLDGRDVYLGPHGTPESRAEYDRQVAVWVAAGRRLQREGEGPGTTVVELVAAYDGHCEREYAPAADDPRRRSAARPGPTKTLLNIRRALGFLLEARTVEDTLVKFGEMPVERFGPLALKAVRDTMIARGLARKTVTDYTGWVKACFRWGVEMEMVPAGVYHGLQAVRGLRRGRSAARETDPVRPVAEATIRATVAQMTSVVRDMVEVEWLTGMRPGELCAITSKAIDTTGAVWFYRPWHHKTRHLGKERHIAIGPRAQEILRRYLRHELEAPLFSPAESEAERRAARHAARQTPLHYGNRPGTNRSRAPKRRAGDRYTVDSYRRAIERACERAFPPPAPLAREEGETEAKWLLRLTPEQRAKVAAWHKAHRWAPNQLRHTRATEVRRAFGLEGAGAVLGHSNLDVTQIYAERNLALAERIALATG